MATLLLEAFSDRKNHAIEPRQSPRINQGFIFGTEGRIISARKYLRPR
jgi:hypothetical protein